MKKELITELQQTTMTQVVNEIDAPNQFLKRLLWPVHEPVETETIQLETEYRGREIAPFVRKNGEAIMVGGRNQRAYAVEAPNIRIKRPLSPSVALFQRGPGEPLFSPGAEAVASRVQQIIAKDLEDMNNMITNAEEYLCSLALQGTISYEVADEEVFTITFPRPAGNNITLTTFWDDGTPANVRPLQDIYTVKQVIAEDGSPTITDAICGSEAAAALMELAESGNLPSFNTASGIRAGTITFVENFNDDGVLFLGEMGGIRFWTYQRTATLRGTSVNMIRPKYVEFVSTSNAAGRVLYYGAIMDMQALRGRAFVGERFSKSWELEDPSTYIGLVTSRPLPVLRRLGAHVSMKVVSG